MPIDWSSVDPGCGVVDGVEMLVQLAMQLSNFWTGIVPEEEVFRRALAAAPGLMPSDLRADPARTASRTLEIAIRPSPMAATSEVLGHGRH